MMDLLKALRLSQLEAPQTAQLEAPQTAQLEAPRIALVGSGGKSTALFQLAHRLPPPVIVTATTHLSLQQTLLADRWVTAANNADLPGEEDFHGGVTLVTGPSDVTGRTLGVDAPALERLLEIAGRLNCPLLIEADGSRQLPLKAPADHEPAIPSFCNLVIVLVGLSVLEKPLSPQWVHRPERFTQLTGLNMDEIITSDVIIRYLIHPQGGLKGIPPQARKIALLNQADTPTLQSAASSIAAEILPEFDSALVASLENPLEYPAGPVFAVHERIAGVILAAGAARRFGQPKLLLLWKDEPIIRHVVRNALASKLDPVVVVAGEHLAAIQEALAGLEVMIVHNPDWEKGQSTSLQAGLKQLPQAVGSAVFLLGDQPQIPAALIRSLVELHAASLSPIVAPLVDGQRANPVLFDRIAFPDLMHLSGDTGGRHLFSRYPAEWLEWHDSSVLFDIDTPEDYRRLLDG